MTQSPTTQFKLLAFQGRVITAAGITTLLVAAPGRLGGGRDGPCPGQEKRSCAGKEHRSGHFCKGQTGRHRRETDSSGRGRARQAGASASISQCTVYAPLLRKTWRSGEGAAAPSDVCRTAPVTPHGSHPLPAPSQPDEPAGGRSPRQPPGWPGRQGGEAGA